MNRLTTYNWFSIHFLIMLVRIFRNCLGIYREQKSKTTRTDNYLKLNSMLFRLKCNGIEESFEFHIKNSKDTSAVLGMTLKKEITN